MQRKRLSRQRSQKDFRKKSYVHPKNAQTPSPLYRGGIRL